MVSSICFGIYYFGDTGPYESHNLVLGKGDTVLWGTGVICPILEMGIKQCSTKDQSGASCTLGIFSSSVLSLWSLQLLFSGSSNVNY